MQAAAKAVLAMQQKPPDPPGAALASAPAPGQDREAALALSGEEAFARRAMYVPFPMTAVTRQLTVFCMSQTALCQDFCMDCESHTICEYPIILRDILQADSAFCCPVSMLQCHAMLAFKGRQRPSTHVSVVPAWCKAYQRGCMPLHTVLPGRLQPHHEMALLQP